MIKTSLRQRVTDALPTKKNAAAPPPKQRLPRLVYYPETDGEPMADSDYPLNLKSPNCGR